MEIVIWLKRAGIGASAGLIAAAVGYLKQFKAEGANWEKFEWGKFLGTAFLGAVIGGFAGFLDWDRMTAEEFLASGWAFRWLPCLHWL